MDVDHIALANRIIKDLKEKEKIMGRMKSISFVAIIIVIILTAAVRRAVIENGTRM